MKPDLSQEFCTLPDFYREELLSAQSVGQQFGWQIENFDMPKVWKETCGDGVTIAVIDSGCDMSHPDLKNNLLPGYNVVNPRLPPQDDNGHGTHVAGIIAAENNDQGIVGVSYCSKILPIKVLNKMGAGRMDHVVEGINIAIKEGVDLICMSLGTRNPLQEVEDVIRKAADAGIICFVAAGNAGSSKQLLYPAAYDITISIGAIDERSMRADFSCTGPNLDFVAPGVNIYSTVPLSAYAMMSGTSQAAPFACGIAGLILSHRRKADPKIKMVKADYVNAMKDNALDVEGIDEKYKDLGNRFFQGFGIINPSHFTEWLEQKKVEMIAQSMSNVLSDVGMVNDKTDVSLLKRLASDITKKLKEFQAKEKAKVSSQSRRRKPRTA